MVSIRAGFSVLNTLTMEFGLKARAPPAPTVILRYNKSVTLELAFAGERWKYIMGHLGQRGRSKRNCGEERQNHHKEVGE